MVAVLVVVVGLMWTSAAAQWLNHPTRGLPRTADGKPDLSGVWQPASDPTGTAGGVEGIVAPRFLIDIMRDLNPNDIPFQPWAEALYKQRNVKSRRGNPLIRCLPAGVPRLDAYTHPYKIVQTRDVIVFLYRAHETARCRPQGDRDRDRRSEDLHKACLLPAAASAAARYRLDRVHLCRECEGNRWASMTERLCE